MLRDDQFKLIYYPAGNCRQLFDLRNDPLECHNLANSANHVETLQRLTDRLIGELYGSDKDWLDADGSLVGMPDQECPSGANRGLALQRGVHWPPAPVTPPKIGETNSGTN